MKKTLEKELQKAYKVKEYELIIDDIIDIYESKYSSYDAYLKLHLKLNELIDNENSKFLTTHKIYCRHPILEEEIYNYIKKEKENQNDKKWIYKKH